MLFGTDRPAEYEQQSHELRFTYDAGGPLKLVAGVYDWQSEYDIRLRSWITFVVPGVVLDIPQYTHQETDSQAAFFEADYAFTDSWTLTVGGRYTKDEKLTQQRGNLPADASTDWSEFTPKVGLRYRINDDAMVYATYRKAIAVGASMAGSIASNLPRFHIIPNSLENYELGFKSEFSGGRFRLNGAFFCYGLQG